MSRYLETVEQVYAAAAKKPEAELCCTQSPLWHLPDLRVPGFMPEDLHQALAEVFRILQPGGLFSTSDPITPEPLPASLTGDERLRARCLSGCQTLEDYLAAITAAGFGRVEIRSRSPYRCLA